MSSEIKITETKIQLYRLRDIGSFGWADISIDEAEKSGRISISSDWGSWSNYWGSCGCPFKQFLIQVSKNIHYVAGKLGTDNWFDFDKTIEKLKINVLEYRRRDDLDADTARKMYDEIKEIENESCTNDTHFYTLFHGSEYLSRWYEYDEIPIERDVTPQFKAFWEKAYLPFCEHLKKEINYKMTEKVSQ